MSAKTRVLAATLMVALFPLVGRSLEKVDKQIAKYSAIIAGNLLSEDLSDDKALTLFRMAGAINPKDENFLYIHALLARDMKPEKTDTKVTLEKLLSVIRERAIYLHEKKYPKNSSVASLILLYSKVVEKYKPVDRDILVVQQALAVDGVTAQLDDLLDGKFKLEASPTRPVTTPPVAGQMPPVPTDPVAQEKTVTIDTDQELRRASGLTSLFDLQRGMEFRDKAFFISRRGGGFESRFRLVGDFQFSVRGNFDNAYVEIAGKSLKVECDQDKATWLSLVREGDEIVFSVIADGGESDRMSIRRGDCSFRFYTRSSPQTVKLTQFRLKGQIAPLSRDSSKVVKAVNAGGGVVVSADKSFIFERSEGFNNVKDADHTLEEVAKTENDIVYSTHVYEEDFRYSVQLAPGPYKVTLMLAETYWDESGERLFDVSIEGKQVIKELDLMKETRKFSAYDKTYKVVLTDASLDIDFHAHKDNANIYGIIIEKDF